MLQTSVSICVYVFNASYCASILTPADRASLGEPQQTLSELVQLPLHFHINLPVIGASVASPSLVVRPYFRLWSTIYIYIYVSHEFWPRSEKRRSLRFGCLLADEGLVEGLRLGSGTISNDSATMSVDFTGDGLRVFYPTRPSSTGCRSSLERGRSSAKALSFPQVSTKIPVGGRNSRVSNKKPGNPVKSTPL